MTAVISKRIVSKAIAFGDAGIGTLIKVADVAAGEIVKKVWAEVGTAWNSVTSDTMTIGIAKTDGTSPTALATVNAQTASAAVASTFQLANAAATLGAQAGRAIAACEVFVKVVSVGGSLSAGAATVYAEIEALEGDAGAAYAVPAVVDGTGTSGETVSHVA